MLLYRRHAPLLLFHDARSTKQVKAPTTTLMNPAPAPTPADGLPEIRCQDRTGNAKPTGHEEAPGSFPDIKNLQRYQLASL